MSAEKLILVTDFASLRAGDLVVVKNCELCARARCCGMLLGLTVPYAWSSAPSCVPDRNSHVSETTVAAGRAFRVVTPPPAAETRETARPRKLERVRR